MNFVWKINKNPICDLSYCIPARCRSKRTLKVATRKCWITRPSVLSSTTRSFHSPFAKAKQGPNSNSISSSGLVFLLLLLLALFLLGFFSRFSLCFPLEEEELEVVEVVEVVVLLLGLDEDEEEDAALASVFKRAETSTVNVSPTSREASARIAKEWRRTKLSCG